MWGRVNACLAIGLGSLLITAGVSPALRADSTPWAALGVGDTGTPYSASIDAVASVLSASGALYSVGNGDFYCCTPTLTIGDVSSDSVCVEKTNPSNQPAFAVLIGGADIRYISAFAIGPDGSAYIAGLGSSIATTPGAWKAHPPSQPGSWLCKLSGADGHALYCTYVDAYVDDSQSFAIDALGNAYFAGACLSTFTQICVEKLSPAGDSAPYLIPTGLSRLDSWTANTYLATDPNGNVCVANWEADMACVSAAGGLIATVHGSANAQPFGLAFDPAGDPQVAIGPGFASGPRSYYVRRYKADLSSVLFETALPYAYFTGMSIDPTGAAFLWGAASTANLAVVHPTQTCTQGGSPLLARIDSGGELVQVTYLSTFPGGPYEVLAGASMLFTGSGAILPVQGLTDWSFVQLGPAASEIRLACIANAATLVPGPLAPNQIVSLFGAQMGPNQEVVAEPGANAQFPAPGKRA